MLRYYPSFRVIKNLATNGGEFLLNGVQYKGKYYLDYSGKPFSGPSPEIGPSEPLTKRPNYNSAPGLNNMNISDQQKKDIARKSEANITRIPGKPNSYYPKPTEQDYTRGYVIRYFTKKENENGYIIEISQDEYNSIVNGTADYDISIYQTTQILWKLTGPLNNTRKSQYNVIPGIIETNQRLTEQSNKTFIGMVDFIGGDYTKFARPTM
jgi:hypothetical protein